VFEYGTFKQISDNHDRLYIDVLEVVLARTLGHLYDLPYGFHGMIPVDDGP